MTTKTYKKLHEDNHKAFFEGIFEETHMDNQEELKEHQLRDSLAQIHEDFDEETHQLTHEDTFENQSETCKRTNDLGSISVHCF